MPAQWVEEEEEEAEATTKIEHVLYRFRCEKTEATTFNDLVLLLYFCSLCVRAPSCMRLVFSMYIYTTHAAHLCVLCEFPKWYGLCVFVLLLFFRCRLIFMIHITHYRLISCPKWLFSKGNKNISRRTHKIWFYGARGCAFSLPFLYIFSSTCKYVYFYAAWFERSITVGQALLEQPLPSTTTTRAKETESKTNPNRLQLHNRKFMLLYIKWNYTPS